MRRFSFGATGLLLLTALMVGAVAGKEKQGMGPAAWIGAWSASPEQDMTIALSPDGFLMIEGFASWGASDPERVERGAINIGEFSVRVPVEWIDRQEGQVEFAVGVDGDAIRPVAAQNYDCAITLGLADDMLTAEDNGMCGGHNVTFNGVYSRQ